jgi:hypothetical protein
MEPLTSFPRPGRMIRDWHAPELGRWTPTATIAPSYPSPFPFVFVNIHPECRAFLNFTLDLTLDPIAVTVIPDCVLVPGFPFITTRSFLFFPINFDQNEHFRHFPFVFPISEMRTIEEGVYFCHKHHSGYFHVVCETMPHLMCFPRAIIERSALIYSPDIMQPIFTELMDVLEIRPGSLHPLSEQVFVRRLHVCTPWDLSNFRAPEFFEMVTRIIRKLGGPPVEPTKHVAYNRQKRSRMLTNFRELMAAIAAEVPGSAFVIMKTHPPGLANQIQFFRAVRCILAVRGSILANMMWMQPGARVIEIQSLHCDPAFTKMAWLFGMRAWEVTFPIFLLHNPFPANISLVVQTVRMALADVLR